MKKMLSVILCMLMVMLAGCGRAAELPGRIFAADGWNPIIIDREEDANIPLDNPEDSPIENSLDISLNLFIENPVDNLLNLSKNLSTNISGNISMKDFWKTEGIGSNGTVKFATGLEIVFPEEWQGKTVLYSADELDDTGIVAICEKGNADAGIGGDLFYLYFFEYTQDMTVLYDWEKVLGLYRQGGKEYVLVQDRPGDRCYSEDDQALIDAYLKLNETVEDVVIKTDNMPGFIKCGIEDLEWVRYEGDI